MTNDGTFVWLVGQKTEGPDAGADILGRWAGIM